MTHYIVVSPEMLFTIPVLDDGSGPLEPGACAVTVDAETRDEAKVKALHSSEFANWVDQQRGDGRNPLWGLKAYAGKCKHGVCHCDICHGWCDDCVADLETRSEA